MQTTKIRWADASWNPVTGCTKVSPGCLHCYAETLAERYRGGNAFPDGFDLTLRPHKLDEPRKWKKPARVFVNSMSDLFHKDIPDSYLCQIWEVMLTVDRHQYLILTKRAERMAHKVRTLGLELPPHIWLGVSVEKQKYGDLRIPLLLDTRAHVHFLSCEPLLGPLDLSPWINDLQWIITGGESGYKRRPAEYDWFRDIRDQCVMAGVPYTHKQGNAQRSEGDKELDGVLWAQMPEVAVAETAAAQMGIFG